jgi:hypothetical protein
MIIILIDCTVMKSHHSAVQYSTVQLALGLDSLHPEINMMKFNEMGWVGVG